MAPGSWFDGELLDAPLTSQAADLSDNTNDMSDHLFNAMTSNVKECDYTDTNVSNQIFSTENDSLSLIYLNIRSLNANFNDLHVFVRQLSFKPDVICLSDSRINQPLENIEIDGYNFTNVKAESQAGGVAVYVSNVLNCLQIESFHLHGAESLWLKISRRKNNEFVVLSTVYRHPSKDAKKFINNFSHCLEKLTYENKTFYILGDFNTNVNEAANRSLFGDSYLQALSSNGAH